MRTTIKCLMGSKLGKIRPGTAELAALKNPIDILLIPFALRPGVWTVFWTLIMFLDNMVNQMQNSFSSGKSARKASIVALVLFRSTLSHFSVFLILR